MKNVRKLRKQMNARCFLSHATGCVSTLCARDCTQVQPTQNKGRQHLLCTTYTHAPTHPKRTKYHKNNAHRVTSHRQKNSDTRPSIHRTPPRREYRMLFADFAVKVADQLQPHCCPRFSRLTQPFLFSPGELRISVRGLPRVSHVSASRSFASWAHVNQPAARTSINPFRYLSLSRRRHTSACSKRHSCSWPHARTVSSQQLLLPRYQSRAWEVTQSLSSRP